MSTRSDSTPPVHTTASEAEPESFPAIVIGSGFGGSVTAYRLQQECNRKGTGSVLLLERGMPYPPRSFARTPREVARNFWDPSSSLFGLFEFWRFEHSRVVVSSGLGGGSLIYANVIIEKPAETFAVTGGDGAQEPWPLTKPQLQAHYETVRAMIGVEQLPPGYAHPASGPALVPKTRQFLDAAAQAGLHEPQQADLAISFAGAHGPEPGASLGRENLHGRERRTCTLVGECNVGCNEGAKNTLDFTYLSRFLADGGTIRTCCEATEIRRLDDGGYEVHYRQHLRARRRVIARGAAEDKLEQDERLLDPDEQRGSARVRAKVVVLAAGTLGSTRLLLASRSGLPPLSGQLGRRFSSNGDLLMFARGCVETDGAASERQRDLAPSHGPVITAYATAGEGEERLWLQDAGGPLVSEWGWQLPAMPGQTARTLWGKRRELLDEALGRSRRRSLRSADLAGVLGSAPASASMMPMLAMGRDRPGGRLRLDRDALTLDWDPANSAAHFERAEAAAADVAAALGGRLWPHTARRRKRFRGLAVHPLGGCPMGTHPADGVVDGNGEVFGCSGLFVADGSVMPGPVGPNPSLTIAAIANHIADTAAARV